MLSSPGGFLRSLLPAPPALAHHSSAAENEAFLLQSDCSVSVTSLACFVLRSDSWAEKRTETSPLAQGGSTGAASGPGGLHTQPARDTTATRPCLVLPTQFCQGCVSSCVLMLTEWKG